MRVYVDTSVIGGCFDSEFQTWSKALCDEFQAGVNVLMISDLTFRELEPARQEVKDVINRVSRTNRVDVIINDEAIKLAETCVTEGALSSKSFNDALHIALATINRADVLASWNFKHIVNINRIRLYNSINLRLGYPMIEIRAPREILKPIDDGKE